MIVLAEAVYLRPAVLNGRQTFLSSDYLMLHMTRLAFAEENLFGPHHTLPAWSPREFLGAPFAANLQSFPWIPTRFVLLLFSPETAIVPAVAIAVLLAAVFMYLFCRRCGFSEVAAAASGWTFACAGYFSSRVAAGHLPLLEAYPALPLLLWLADRALDPARIASRRWDIAWLALASACVALAGHPQLPAYAIAATLAYIAWRGRGWLRVRLAAGVALGLGLTLAAWWPMFLLIGKSTRVLPLDPPDNDISFPYGRILALFDPGIDGWPPILHPADGHIFSGYPNGSYFWDTESYIGLAPVAAAAALLIVALVRRRAPSSRSQFVALLGTVALLCSLPFLDPWRHIVPGMFLRSPARLLYLTTFSLAAALGAAVDAALHWKGGGKWIYAAVPIGLLLHGADLGAWSHRFAIGVDTADIRDAEEPLHAWDIGDRRMAYELTRWLCRRQYDEIGTFDSVLLARPYRALLALGGFPPGYNNQMVDGARLALPALQAGAVALVLTPGGRRDLTPIGRLAGLNVYRVPDPEPRAGFYGAESVEYLPEDAIPGLLQSRGSGKKLFLPAAAQTLAVPAANSAAHGTVIYHRPSSDEIQLEVSADGPGVVNVIESYDPGWRAQVDGRPAPVIAANGFTLAAAVTAGKHTVRFHYSTPGRKLGLALSCAAAALLALLIVGKSLSR